MKAKVHSVGIGETSNEMKELNTLAEISKLGKNQEILSAEQGVPNADEGILSAEQQVPNTMDATTAEEKEMVHDKIVQIDDKHYQKIGRGEYTKPFELLMLQDWKIMIKRFLCILKGKLQFYFKCGIKFFVFQGQVLFLYKMTSQELS